MKLTRLLTKVANNAAERADCAAGQPLTAPESLPAVPEGNRVGDEAVCGLADLKFPGRPENRSKTMQTVQDGTGPTWACEVAEHATYAVTQDPHIVAGIRSSPGYTQQPQVAGHQILGFDNRHVVADCAGTPTYFSLEFGQAYWSAVETPGAPRTKDLFTNFVDTAGKHFGCATAAS
ncbi:hypothetical protein GCM10022384_69690 [Streptomyces marokkonensis]|uniref:Uncharacterized protein n=1 Tax=Streptomyces marokkonensis TaxID=324855 RepID=A0ABP7SW59_9ACTN